jgi:phage tail sheath protein FI
MPTYRTPDVYVEEISVFPPSVAEVESAIPAFIGYTEKALRRGENIGLKPTMIRSYTQFQEYFGDPQPLETKVTVAADGKITEIKPPEKLKHNLAYSLKMFYENGGGKCYVVSVGDYAKDVTFDDFEKGLAAVETEDEPTLIVFPEAVLLDDQKYGDLVQAALRQCGSLKDRFGIFDVFEGNGDELDLEASRARFGSENLKYGAAYFPFLRTSMNHWVTESEDNVKVKVGTAAEQGLGELKTENNALYNAIKAELVNHFVDLPPSGAVAGVYAATDTNRGVWKAPANVGLSRVVEPLVKVNNPDQGDMNIDASTGKSINVLRSFYGVTKVWGARTLDGNSNEWRYINVRRFFNMVEESVKKSTYWAVFESNDANTWVKVRGMIESYLTQKWREGALAGASPKDAFFVRCGLGTTMNAQDILEGRMNVEIGMAVVRPAEFIILKFSHKMQTS